MSRFIRTSVLAVLTLVLFAWPALSQTLKTDKGLYLKARVGLSTYQGDYDGDPSPEYIGQLKDASWSVGGELGYQFNKRVGAGLGIQWANYSRIGGTGSYTRRWSIMGLVRYTFNPDGGLSPYIHAGGNVSVGGNKAGFGPTLGAGLDLAITDGASLFLEATSNFVFPDDAADGFSNQAKFDVLNFLGVGLRVGAGSGRYGALLSEPSKWFSRCTPVEIQAVEGPQEFEMGQPITFRAVVNEDASEPVTISWDFGDGSTAVGQEATHTFEVPQGVERKSFTIQVTASNCGGEVMKTLTVTVINPCPYPAEIVTITPTPASPREGDEVRFTANVRGTEPITYRWNFGDGNTSTAPNPTHVYAESGTYTVTLEVTNCAGTDRRSITLVVQPPPIELIELNTVYFGFNRSSLDDEAKQRLMENVEELKKYPEVCVRIDAYTDHVGSDQYNLRLSERRARAVEVFYVEQGIAASRVLARGLGKAPVPCDKEDPGPGCRRNRRAESIPIDCDEMQQ